MRLDPDFICVGQIGAPHGLRGAVRVRSYTQTPRALLDFHSFFLLEHPVPLIRERCLREEGGRLFVFIFKDIIHRASAESLKNQKLFVKRDQLPLLEEDAFYHKDLVGLCVRAENGQEYGKVGAVENFGAGDLLEIIPPHQTASFWLPFRTMYVPEVNLEEGYIKIQLEAWKESGLT